MGGITPDYTEGNRVAQKGLLKHTKDLNAGLSGLDKELEGLYEGVTGINVEQVKKDVIKKWLSKKIGVGISVDHTEGPKEGEKKKIG